MAKGAEPNLWQPTCQSQSNIVAINWTWSRYAPISNWDLFIAAGAAPPNKKKRERKTQTVLKQKENVIKHIPFWHRSGSPWILGHPSGEPSDKDKKCYVNFVGTDRMSKPNLRSVVCPQSEIYDSLGKLEIYLFTRPVRGILKSHENLQHGCAHRWPIQLAFLVTSTSDKLAPTSFDFSTFFLLLVQRIFIYLF